VADSGPPTDTCRARVERTFLATPQPVLGPPVAGLVPWDVQRARACARACQVPVLSIEAAHRPADLGSVAALGPPPVPAEAVGSGQFLAPAVPEQINPMIDRFPALAGRSPG
jgi:hypothetical protein